MRLYRLLLAVLFPADFRRRFGDDMAAVYADRRRAARKRGRGAVARLWMDTVLDLLAHGLAERRAGRTKARGRKRRQPMLQTLWQDVRYAIRTLRRRPAFTAVALATLALGIGANTAIFSVVEAVILRPLPYPDRDRIVRIYETNRRYNFDRGVANPFNFDVWEREARSFHRLAAIRSAAATLTGAGEPVRVRVQRVMPAFFEVMGVGPLAGRVVSAEDTDLERPVAVLAHAFWTSRFGGDPDVVGRAIVLDDRAVTVIGVMPPAFQFPGGTDLYQPLRLTPADRAGMTSWYLGVVGTLAPGVSIDDALAEMNAISSRLEAQFPKERADRGATVVGLRQDLSSRVADGLRMLQGMVVVVLLVAYANVANLAIASASARRREIGIRASIGAGRGRLVCQLLTENVVLAMAGAVAGLAVAGWSVGAIVALAPDGMLPEGTDAGLNATVLAFTFGLALMTGLAAGLAPAWIFSRADGLDALKDGGAAATGTGRRSQRMLRAGLVAAEVALAVVLVSGSLLLARSFVRLTSQDPGFARDRLLTAYVTLPASRYAEPGAQRLFWNDLFERLRALPGVSGATGSTALPFSNWEWQTWFEVESRPPAPDDGSSIRTVTPGYFATLGIPLRAGREFTAVDREGADPVVVVNDAFARRFLSDSPIGQRIRTERPGPAAASSVLIGVDRGPDYSARWMTVVGVAASSRHTRLDRDPAPEIYRPLAQSPAPTMILALRASGNPAALSPIVRAAVHELDPDLPVQAVRTMDEAIGATTARRRFDLSLVAVFAGLAAVLAVAGIYAVTAFVVGLRTREAGIRLALGASPARVQALVIRQGLVPVVVGLGLGVGVALLAGGRLRDQLFAIEPTDPGTLAISAVVFLSAAALAAWIPALRAGRADPLQVLRVD